MRNSKKRPIVTERSDTDEKGIVPTSRARRSLYNLIATFRKDAAYSDDELTSSLFNYAANVVAGLARLFRRHESDTAKNVQSTFKRNEDN